MFHLEDWYFKVFAYDLDSKPWMPNYDLWTQEMREKYLPLGFYSFWECFVLSKCKIEFIISLFCIPLYVYCPSLNTSFCCVDVFGSYIMHLIIPQ